MQLKIDAALPEVKIVAHPRATRLKLSISASGIRLTTPRVISPIQIQQFLKQQLPWLQQNWSILQLKQTAAQSSQLPQQLQLCYQASPYEIVYRDMACLFQLHHPHQLWIHAEHAQLGLTQFVIDRAKHILPQQLLAYARHHELKVQHVRIATPTTRWGSCNGQQKIMLHAGLLLMPQQHADYVLWHELTHLQHMHHQSSFWQQLEQFYTGAKRAQAQLKHFRLPSWWRTK